MLAVGAFASPEYSIKAANPLFLKKMPLKIWWNSAFKKRIPFLVSETVGRKRDECVVDFLWKPESKVKPASVRIVTPWEEVVPAQISAIGNGGIEIIIKTSLRPYQNKPFFIYYDNPEGSTPPFDSDLRMKTKNKCVTISNEKIQVAFASDHKRSGKIRQLRIIGSSVKNQLTERNTGVVWDGFDLGKEEFSEKPVVTMNGIFKKSLKYSSKNYMLEFSVYTCSPRVDYKITSSGPKRIQTQTKWLAGGGDAYDTFYYEGLKGPMKFKAGPDTLSDQNDVYPRKILTKWMKYGWAAIEDSKRMETVGYFWPPKQLKFFRYYSQTINGGETFTAYFDISKPLTGAIVAINGDWKKFRKAYIDWKNPPTISLGISQAFSTNIIAKIPSFTRGFTRDYKFSENRDGTRITDDFAKKLIRNIREYGGNAAKLNISRVESIPISKELYARYIKLYDKYYKGKWRRKTFPSYEEITAKKAYLKCITEAAHEKGLAVRTWDMFCPFRHCRENYLVDPEATSVVLEIYKSIAAAGVDLLQTYCADEWAVAPPECGSVRGEFWTKHPDAWFALNDQSVKFAKRVRDLMKKSYPDLPLSTLCSSDGWLPKLQFVDEKAPYLDTVENEFVPGMIPNMPSLKYGIKRMLGIFGNDGRSIQHHFYYYQPNSLWRVSEMEIPMMLGVKSFSHENLGGGLNNPELLEITADFYHLTDLTAIDQQIATTTPFKFLGVLHDSIEVKDDIRHNRTAMFPGVYSLHEARCKQMTVIKNLPMDLVFNRFFKLDTFKKYKVIFIPSTASLDDQCVAELAKFAEAGGFVIAEGKALKNARFAKIAGVRLLENSKCDANIAGIPMKAGIKVSGTTAKAFVNDSAGNPAIYVNKVGKGKIVYTPYILTDDLNNSRTKELFVRKLITDLAGSGPIIPPFDKLAIMDSFLLEGGGIYFFGVYNQAYETPLNTEILLDVPHPTGTYVLNVRTGERAPFTGKVKVNVPPLRTGFYIIGSDKETSLPKSTPATMLGGVCENPGTSFHEKKNDQFKFEFTAPEKTKTVGVLNINDKRGRQSQAWGAVAIYDFLKKNRAKVKVKYLENLRNKTINGCDAVVVPNMGTALPYQLTKNWWTRLANFAKQGGGVMLMHHSMGIGSVGEPPFPSIGRWSGMYYPEHDFKIVSKHPADKGLRLGDVFHDECWDFDQIAPGENGVVLALGIRKSGVPVPAWVVGEHGKGRVVISGVAIGAGGKRENGKYVKYEAPPKGNLGKILLNSVDWLTER